MGLDVPRTRAAVAELAASTGLTPESLCQGVLEVVNANMEGAIRVISVERGHDPREFALVSFGGAGGMHAADLARRLSIPTVLVPAHPGILSAYGMLVSDYVQEYAHTLLVPAAELTGRPCRRGLRGAGGARPRGHAGGRRGAAGHRGQPLRRHVLRRTIVRIAGALVRALQRGVSPPPREPLRLRRQHPAHAGSQRAHPRHGSGRGGAPPAAGG